MRLRARLPFALLAAALVAAHGAAATRTLQQGPATVRSQASAGGVELRREGNGGGNGCVNAARTRARPPATLVRSAR